MLEWVKFHVVHMLQWLWLSLLDLLIKNLYHDNFTELTIFCWWLSMVNVGLELIVLMPLLWKRKILPHWFNPKNDNPHPWQPQCPVHLQHLHVTHGHNGYNSTVQTFQTGVAYHYKVAEATKMPYRPTAGRWIIFWCTGS